MNKLFLLPDFDPKAEIELIVQWMTKYKEETGCKGVVLGLSGGKDSTVVAMLAKKVFGNNVKAILMPNGEQKDINDSLGIATVLGLDYHIVNIGTIYNNLILNTETTLSYVVTPDGRRTLDRTSNVCAISDKSKTNIPPRIRMTVLYAIAQSLGYRVIGTGNLSESYIGWCTKFGDTGHDFNPIAHLTCSEVMAIGEVLAQEFGLIKEMIFKTPADGLTDSTDEDNFGFSYYDLDGFIRTGECSTPELSLKIIRLHRASTHKRLMPETIKK